MEIYNSDALFGEITNVGMNSEISIRDLVIKINEIMHLDISISKDNNRFRPKNSEVDRLVCDNKKILNHTKWEPRYDLVEGLFETIVWFKKNKHFYKAGFYNV